MTTKAQIQALLQTELTARNRMMYVFLLLVDLAMAAVIGSLLATEPALPPRTQIAFAVMLLIAISWAVLFGSTILRRRVFLAGHKVAAARLGMIFSALFACGMLLVAITDPEMRSTGLAATAVGAGMLATAAVLYTRARRRVHELIERRRVLEQ